MDNDCIVNKFDTPLGEATARFYGDNLVSLHIGAGGESESWLEKYFDGIWENTPHPMLDRLRSELDEYFRGKRREFTIPVEFFGSENQKRVWRALMDVPYGEIRMYGDIAKAAGCASVRATGTMVGKNPVIIIAPCHRVVRSDGQIGNYSGADGSATKKALLEMESGKDAIL